MAMPLWACFCPCWAAMLFCKILLTRFLRPSRARSAFCRETVRTRGVPFPGGRDDRFDFGKFNFPTEFRLSLRRICVKRRRIAGAARRFGVRHFLAGAFFYGANDFADRRWCARAEVVEIRGARFFQLFEH